MQNSTNTDDVVTEMPVTIAANLLMPMQKTQKIHKMNVSRNADKTEIIRGQLTMQMVQKKIPARAIALINAEIRTDDKAIMIVAVKKQAQIMATQRVTTAIVETTTVGHNVMATTKNSDPQPHLKRQLQQRYQASKKADLPN